MMDRREFLFTSLVGALAAPHAAGVQQGETVYRVGYLGGQSEVVDDPFLGSCRRMPHSRVSPPMRITGTET